MPPKMPKAIIFSTVGLSVGPLVIWRVSKASDWLTLKPYIQFSAKLLIPGALMYNIKYNNGRVSRRKPAGLHHRKQSLSISLWKHFLCYCSVLK